MATSTARKPVIHAPAPMNPLEEAEHILRTDGWIVGSMKCSDGKRCAVGAVRAACGLRENAASHKRHTNKAYVQSLHLLAAAINPHYKGSRAMRRQIRDLTDTMYLDPTPKFDTLSPFEQVDALEQFIIDFNDNRTADRKGRNMILRRFTKAAKAYAAS